MCSKFLLKKLDINDGLDIYQMLQEIPKNENGFMNSVNGKTYEEFKEWLKKSDALSHSNDLVDGWKVPSHIYWLCVDNKPVGMAKLRNFLTDKLREEGGHAGYAIRPKERKKGYGNILLKLLIEEARKHNIERMLLTIRNENIISTKVALYNKGQITESNKERKYVWIDCT